MMTELGVTLRQQMESRGSEPSGVRFGDLMCVTVLNESCYAMLRNYSQVIRPNLQTSQNENY